MDVWIDGICRHLIFGDIIVMEDGSKIEVLEYQDGKEYLDIKRKPKPT